MYYQEIRTATHIVATYRKQDGMSLRYLIIENWFGEVGGHLQNSLPLISNLLSYACVISNNYTFETNILAIA